MIYKYLTLISGIAFCLTLFSLLSGLELWWLKVILAIVTIFMFNYSYKNFKKYEYDEKWEEN